jgi:hypothetical protein
MKKLFGFLAGLLLASAGYAATTLETCTAPDGTVLSATIAAAPPIAVTTPPVVTGGSSYTVYANGVLGGGDGNWVADFDNSASEANYKDTTGAPQTGTYDLKFTGNQTYPIWLPYSNNPPKSFPMAGYTQMVFDLKVTIANDPFNLEMIPAGDETCPTVTCVVQLPNTAYGAATFQAGVWYHITIPLASVGVPGFPGGAIYKFGLQEDSGKIGVVFYVNNVRFQ